MSQESMWKTVDSELEISTVNISVGEWGKEQTDRHTKNLTLFRKSEQTSKECLQKIWER